MKIMAALDLSDYADFVLLKAIKTAKQQDAKLDIVVVAEGEETSEKLFGDNTRAAHSYQQKALAQEVTAKVRVLVGRSAAEEIIRYQKAENLDLVVLGRRSRKVQEGSPMGAVARRVAAYATCTVMVVRCMEARDFV